MKKRKLMTPYLAGVLLMGSVCIGSTVYADDIGTTEEIVVSATDTEADEEFKEEVTDNPDDLAQSDEQFDIGEPPGPLPVDPDIEEENPSEDETVDTEETHKGVSISADELFQDDDTTIEADNVFDESTENILHEIFILNIPNELTAGKLTVPVFENSEVTILLDDEETFPDSEIISIVSKPEKIGIKVKPLGDVLNQVQKLVLTLVNTSLEQSEIRIESLLHRFFKDGSDEQTAFEDISIYLKGIRPITEPDTETDLEPSPDYPEEPEPGMDEEPEEKPVDEEEKSEDDKELEKPQKKPIEQIFQVIDHSGMNLLEANVSVLDTNRLIFSSGDRSEETVSGTSLFEKEKVETASVDDADEYIRDTFKEQNTKTDNDDDDRKDPVVSQEVDLGMLHEEKSRIPILAVLLVVAAAAGAFFVPLAKRHYRNSREDNSGMK